MSDIHPIHPAEPADRPLITIVTVTYNAAATLPPTLESVRSQDFDRFEHLIIDGASTDGTPDIVRRDARPWETVISERDRGLYDAMNKGLDRAAATT